MGGGGEAIIILRIVNHLLSLSFRCECTTMSNERNIKTWWGIRHVRWFFSVHHYWLRVYQDRFPFKEPRAYHQGELDAIWRGDA